MTEIMQGATQTLEFPLPTNINLSQTNIYFSATQFGQLVLKKSDSSIHYEGSTVYVDLSQIDTLQFKVGEAKVQLNITSDNGETRIPTYEADIQVLGNQLHEVLP